MDITDEQIQAKIEELIADGFDRADAEMAAGIELGISDGDVVKLET